MGRIIPNENTWVGFAKTLTGTLAAPKLADVTDAVDLTHWVISLNASSSGNVVPTPAFDTKFETSIVGTSTATFTADFYRDDGSDDQGLDAEGDLAWETLPRDEEGYFLISRFGGSDPAGGVVPIASDVIEVWPVIVVSRTMANMSNNTVMTFTLTCSVPEEPVEDAVVAAT